MFKQIRRRLDLTAVATVFSVVIALGQTEQTNAKSQYRANENKAVSSSGWRINYLPAQVTAASTVYLSKDAIKIVTEGEFEVVAKAPTWSAIVTNGKKKLSCELAPSRWKKEGFFVDPPDPREYMNPEKADSIEKINYRGLQSKKRTWQTIESDQFYRHRSKPKRCTIELISTDGLIPFNTMQRAIFASWYGIPNLDGVPLYWANKIYGEPISQRLKVAKLQPLDIGRDTFVPMKGTKRESSMMKLVDHKFSTTIADFMEIDAHLDTPARTSTLKNDKPTVSKLAK